MTMLEKMARAINPEAFAKMDRKRLDFPADPRSRFLEEWPVCDVMSQARAALMAIRDPDDAMLRAGVLEAWADPETVQKAHRAMIDAILEGKA
jgi:hypothetical protein